MSKNGDVSQGICVATCEDLCVEIFKRLPIDSVCRLRSVCKCWNSILSSPLFINLRLSFNPRNLKRYLHVSHRIFNVSGLNYDDLTHKCYTLCTPLGVVVDQKYTIQQLHFPFRDVRENGSREFTCVDVIHGVVCISYSSPTFKSTFLWNPTIRKYVALPPLRFPRHLDAIGFGYNASTKDFKVVVIPLIPSGKYLVYSDRQGSWRTATNDCIKRESYNIFPAQRRPVFLNGTIHWILSGLEARPHKYRLYPTVSVLMFDCESEEFRSIYIPKKVYERSPIIVELYEHVGMLATLVQVTWPGFDVWVMEEYGVSTSWNKLYTISHNIRNIISDPSYEELSPYGPNNPWYKLCDRDLRLLWQSSDHVYDQNMLLMDHPKAQSYAKHEIVTILSEDP